MPKRPVVLVVLDGWGYRAERDGNAIALARTPTWDALTGAHPWTLLEASGLAVGLPHGQMGNSEVGHLNLGAGRIVMQDLVRISESIRDGSFLHNRAIAAAIDSAAAAGRTVHLLGLIGAGGVHAIDAHLFALLDVCEKRKATRVAIHALLDGRDTMPRSGLGYMRELLDRAKGRATVASLGGRYFGMDRDNRWDRVQKWYRVAVQGVGPTGTDALAVIEAAYDRNETDEFVTPTVITNGGQPVAPMRDGDAVICFNYRADRMRQIVRALTQPGFDGFDVSGRPALAVVTMTQYDRTFNVPIAFPPHSMANLVADVVSNAGMTMLRTAETEKYAHVTYFFNGGFEPPYPGEERVLVASQKVATYDLMPEMSAPGVTDVLCSSIEKREHDFILCNYANGDMVGHTGSLPATITAVETVDRCLARVVASAERAGAHLLVTADHGNCEMMIDPATGGPHTAHTTSPVPFVLVDPEPNEPRRRAELRRAVRRGANGAEFARPGATARDDGRESASDWRVRVMRLQACALLVLVAARVHAQVGYLPEKSPYLDLTSSMEWTVLAGEQFSHTDPAAGVGTAERPAAGLRSGEWRAERPVPHRRRLRHGRFQAPHHQRGGDRHQPAAASVSRRIPAVRRGLLHRDGADSGRERVIISRRWPPSALASSAISEEPTHRASRSGPGSRSRWARGSAGSRRRTSNSARTSDGPAVHDRLSRILLRDPGPSTTPAFLHGQHRCRKSRWENNAVLTLGLSYFR